ncbi:M56 family metallopeptidase [Glaciibacter sp. 2TAF33]|uniref:M56 family metallopeptidase n=1 Tax=Glaciibacter sp. 2TAF33 TaxID=3233015 RepID=UPI003F916199
MLIAAWALLVVAVALAWPVPILLSRAHWPTRAPGTALVLWQSIALTGGLSMIGALLVYGLIPFGSTLPTAVVALARTLLGEPLPTGTGIDHVFGLSSAFVLGVHLVLNLMATIVRSERQRRRHRNLVELLSRPLHGRPDTRVIDHAAPVAYCLPGAARSVTVLSNGMLDLLDADELRGVIAHETAHLRQQHHVVLLAFKSWHSALPWFPIANRAENAVALLVEMLADDQARHVVDDRTLARAIVLVGTAGEPPLDPPSEPDVDAPDGAVRAALGDRPFDMVTPRVQRLLGHPSPIPLPARVGLLLGALGLLALPTVLLLIT